MASAERGTRNAERQDSSALPVPRSALERAWDELYIAEGSDWFWWYGDDHSSAQDALFDYLFRKHLQNVYVLLGDPPPAELSRPISRRGQRAVYTLPRSFLDVQVDGRKTFLQWLGAGHYTCQNERGTMAMVTQGPIKELYFGFSADALLVRVDCDTPARTALNDFDGLRVGFTEPDGYELLVRPQTGKWTPLLLGDGQPVQAAEIAVAVEQIVELRVPFAALAVSTDQPIHFYVELLEGQQSRDRAPREGTVNLICPSPHFEQMMWDV